MQDQQHDTNNGNGFVVWFANDRGDAPEWFLTQAEANAWIAEQPDPTDWTTPQPVEDEGTEPNDADWWPVS